jgi:hypothetical protein
MNRQTIVVAGNGPSLAEVVPGTILSDDTIFRVNSFFFEPKLYLGTRVDLAFVSGDPRIVPFICAAIRQAGDIYDLRGWSASTGRVESIAKRWMTAPNTPYRLRDAQLERDLRALETRHQALPTTGMRAVLLAHALGASRIILTGIDLYGGARRYSHISGPHQRALLGNDLDRRGYDFDQHSRDMDLAVLDLLARRGDVELLLAAQVPAIGDVLPLAQPRQGEWVLPMPKSRQIDDWPSWAGIYPIHLLRFLRWVRKTQRNLSGQAP